ncbi:MAG: hypothetical protein QOE14_2990 [Humisphaera sp.]|nr:hypothetical protein [Humisphaera sp.]
MTAADFEKLGVFYLGRAHDLATKTSGDELILYDSKDLTTHAVCVGMTGSGKTGLCLALLEEAAIDGIPAIIIDPKGDLTNLLLTFPNLAPQDFRPWVNEDDARKKGLSADEFAQQQAAFWKSGLEKWGQDGARIQRLRDAADFAIYTPGSNAGIPVSILKSFAAPESALMEDNELLRERISTTATSLLGLLGVDADPIQSREHILISTIFGNAWQQGQDLDLAGLIQQIQNPPVQRIGVLDVESFYPSKERFSLAMRLNNLLAAPGFSSWLEGEPLDIQAILHSGAGKPRHAIFSIAHLGDAERMFFVSLLLNQVLGWMRQQPGTTSLRAIVYMDEIFGYFPPTANPPSKTPLLTLMKQARAFGVGMVLATQNPVDLDYKGLSNAGTWFIGRLQRERDMNRLLDGLEGAAAGQSGRFDRGAMEETLAGLGNRVFLMNNVHEDAPVVFESRWALSYLRGPLTRNQIKTLMDPIKAPPPLASSREATVDAPVRVSATAARSSSSAARPVLPSEITQLFVPLRSNPPQDRATLVYRPALLGCGNVYFTDTKTGVDQQEELCLLAPLTENIVAAEWSSAEEVSFDEAELDREPAEGAGFAPIPSSAGKSKSYDAWKKQFADSLYRGRSLQLFRSASLKQTSKPGESERDFRVRLQQAARERLDVEKEKLRQRYSAKFTSLQERLRRAQQAVEREREQATASKWNTAVSVGATLLGAFLGRRARSIGTVGRATTAARGAGRVYKESQDVARAGETVEAVQAQLDALQRQFDDETNNIARLIDPTTESLETVTLKPKKTNITVRSLVLAWTPYWEVGGTAQPAYT